MIHHVIHRTRQILRNPPTCRVITLTYEYFLLNYKPVTLEGHPHAIELLVMKLGEAGSAAIRGMFDMDILTRYSCLKS